MNGRRHTDQGLERKQQLLDAAEALFASQGYRATRIADICAAAGVAKGKFIFALPGSNGACRDGWEKIIRWQLDSRHTPCNLVEIMPRLLER